MHPQLLGAGRLSVSGEAVNFELEIELCEGPAAYELKAKAEQVMSTAAFRKALQAKIDSRVRESFGADWTVEPLQLGGIDSVKATVTAVYAELGTQKQLAKPAGQALEWIRRDLRELLERKVGATHPIVRAKWTAGSGVAPEELLISSDATAPELQVATAMKRKLRAQLARQQQILFVAVPTAILAGLLLAWAFDYWLIAIAVGTYALPFVVLLASLGGRIEELDADVREIRNELDLRSIDSDELEARAQKLFQVHSFELKRYYDQALRQGRNIFYVGVGCIVLGFGVIVAAVVIVATVDTADFDVKILVAALSATGAILANFIGAIYLRMYSETIRSVTSFHQRLVVTHHLHFGNFLVAKIADADERNKTLATMAATLAQNHSNGAEPAPTA